MDDAEEPPGKKWNITSKCILVYNKLKTNLDMNPFVRGLMHLSVPLLGIFSYFDAKKVLSLKHISTHKYWDSRQISCTTEFVLRNQCQR